MKNINKLLFILILTILLQSCALLKQSQVSNSIIEVDHLTRLHLPTPSQLNMNLTARQILSAHYRTKSFTSEVVVDATPNKLTLVALSGMGAPLFTVIYNGIFIKTSHLPIPHIQRGAKQALLDFILCYGSTQALKTMLKNTNFTLKETSNSRLFLYNKKNFVKISYKNVDHWKSAIILVNNKDHYKIMIEPISITKH